MSNRFLETPKTRSRFLEIFSLLLQKCMLQIIIFFAKSCPRVSETVAFGASEKNDYSCQGTPNA